MMFTLEENGLRLVYIIKMPHFNLMVNIYLLTLIFMCRAVTYSLCKSNTIFEGHKKIHVKIKKPELIFGTSRNIPSIPDVVISLEYNDASLYEHLKIKSWLSQRS